MAIGVAEAAQRLGVSRQRVLQMISGGLLPAERIGRAWSVQESDIARRRVPVGRPLSAGTARGLLELAAGIRPDLSPRDVSRLRAHMVRLAQESSTEGDPAGLLRSWLPGRAVRREMSVADADISTVLDDERFVLSGASDRLAAMSSPHLAEGYVSSGNAQEFLADHFAVESDDRSRANLIVHVAEVVPPPSPVLVAADLADYRGGREDRQARALLAEWFDSGDYDTDLLFGRART
jgi:excisionase family DNA binding protein